MAARNQFKCAANSFFTCTVTHSAPIIVILVSVSLSPHRDSGRTLQAFMRIQHHFVTFTNTRTAPLVFIPLLSSVKPH
jgi:hypothetical protein